MGACLFTFVFGRIPFTAPNLIKLFKVVQNEPLRFPEDTPISEDLRHLLTRMLEKVIRLGETRGSGVQWGGVGLWTVRGGLWLH